MSWHRAARVVALVLALQAGSADVSAGRQPAAVLIFAAASLQTVLDDLTPALHKATGVRVRASYAASSALARQIENGAPADLFISADHEWMAYVRSRTLVHADSIVDLAGNRLVLIAPAHAGTRLAIAPGFPLAAALGRDRLAIAEPSSVPAGRYAQAALARLGVWDAVVSKLAPAENVRAALLLVSRAETPLGIVYRTDALADPTVAIVDMFPADIHPPIRYPAAITVRAGPDARAVLTYLTSSAARQVFERHGFTPTQ
jgi:molybdate transport system substrate-binding protein